MIPQRCPMLDKGDILIVSEVSRIGRSMSDINKFVNDELKPRGVRLVIVQMGIDLDCSHLKAIDEMLLSLEPHPIPDVIPDVIPETNVTDFAIPLGR